MLFWNFHLDPTLGTLSKLHLSSKSVPGVLEAFDVLDRAGVGVRVSKISIENFPESFIKIQHHKPHQDSTYPPSLFLESWRPLMFLIELELVSGLAKYPLKTSLKVSSRSNISNLIAEYSWFSVFWCGQTNKQTNGRKMPFIYTDIK